MNPQEIKEFLESIRNTDIEELKYHSDGNTLRFKKSEIISELPIQDVKDIAVEDKEENEEKFVLPIKSTMVGVFISFPEPNAPLFVKEGDHIVVDQKIGQVEAMKIIRDVKAKIEGKIVKVLVSNGQAIEYGQGLFLVDTRK